MPEWPQTLVRGADFRQAVACGIGAVAAAAVGSAVGNPHGKELQVRVVALVCVVVFVVLGVLATRLAAGEASRVLDARAGAAAAAVVRLTILVFGYLLILLVALSLLAVPIQHLLVGGALTAVLLGVAAQQALGNVFAGLVLLLNRPFTLGDHIRVRSGALGGEFDGTVTGMGLTYVSVDTTTGSLHVPNASVLAAAVGPWVAPVDEAPAPAEG